MYAKEQVFRARIALTGRSARTALQIEDAFRSALVRRPFNEITAAEIADSCGIARSTVYRKYATTTELLWIVARPIFEDALACALEGDHAGFEAASGRLWSSAGLVGALINPAASRVRQKLATLTAARIERLSSRANASTCGMVISGAWFALLAEYGEAPEIPSDALSELTAIIYVAAFLTPEGMRSLARRSVRQAAAGTFPAAVSVRESLASDDYIVSMIDGRPYRSLTRHIARFGMTANEYRRCFGLDAAYPMVARGYSERRRTLATNAGFGARPGAPATFPVQQQLGAP